MTKKAVKTPPATASPEDKATATFQKHSDLYAVKIVVYGQFITEEGQQEVELGQVMGTGRQFNPSKGKQHGSFGFNFNGKLLDLSPTGIQTKNRLQFSGNAVCIKSNLWPDQ